MVERKTPRNGVWIGSQDGLTIRCFEVETGPGHLGERAEREMPRGMECHWHKQMPTCVSESDPVETNGDTSRRKIEGEPQGMKRIGLHHGTRIRRNSFRAFTGVGRSPPFPHCPTRRSNFGRLLTGTWLQLPWSGTAADLSVEPSASTSREEEVKERMAVVPLAGHPRAAGAPAARGSRSAWPPRRIRDGKHKSNPRAKLRSIRRRTRRRAAAASACVSPTRWKASGGFRFPNRETGRNQNCISNRATTPIFGVGGTRNIAIFLERGLLVFSMWRL